MVLGGGGRWMGAWVNCGVDGVVNSRSIWSWPGTCLQIGRHGAFLHGLAHDVPPRPRAHQRPHDRRPLGARGRGSEGLEAGLRVIHVELHHGCWGGCGG